VLAGAGTYYWRVAFVSLFKKRLSRPQKLLIIGAGKASEMLHHGISSDPDYQVVGLISDDSSPLWQLSAVHGDPGRHATLRQVSKALEVNVLVLAGSYFRGTEFLRSALECKLDGITIYDMPTFYEKTTGKVPVEHVNDSWLVFTPLLGVNKNVYNNKLKRALDLTLSLFGLVFTLPLALAIAVAVRLDSHGPVLYRQRRVGLNGKIFTLFKFRSMENGLDRARLHAGEKNDPRITRVGRIIRLFRMDEIPQLWNVLKGELSFIGPRALVEEEVAEFESKIPYFSLRHSIRPGITGWAQINYRHGASVEDGLEKLQYDLFYVKNLSPFLDFLIFFKTIKVVLFRKGAR
jgi:exopolysaccharide biosynthesis polyprenyl glycosylphosphotransferase